MQELATLLEGVACVIAYDPLRTEVPLTFLTETAYVIPARPSLNPEEEAERVLEFVGNESAAILVPGRQFDSTGTRHGQGGGWYDRFLTHIPRSWKRIGVCFDDQFSQTPLIRQAWDQPVDYVYVVGREDGSGRLYSSHTETP